MGWGGGVGGRGEGGIECDNEEGILKNVAMMQ